MDMMTLVDRINGYFDTRELEAFERETGVLFKTSSEIKKIGYCTNLTLDVIEKAYKQNCNMILTHHDAWDFMYGLKEACIEKLKAYNIGHYFIHLPLDDCSFGTNMALAECLGLKVVEEVLDEDGFMCGRVAEFDTLIEMKDLAQRMEDILKESVKAWKFNKRPVQRVCIVCGGGNMTEHVKIAVDHNCDVYITGEQVLYMLEYAQHTGINIIIGSHTFTELPGVEELAMKVQQDTGIEISRIDEVHLETSNWKTEL